MNSSTLTLESVPKASQVAFTQHDLVATLVDGRVVQVPLAWYPRLEYAGEPERTHYELFQEGVAIHWPLLDEDIRVIDLLAGRRSKECAKSLERWKQALNEQRNQSQLSH